MIVKAFALLDIKTGIYSLPFFMAHSGQAIRAAMEMGLDSSIPVGRYPFDFRLVGLGEFDDGCGLLLSTAHNDFGTVGALLAQHDVRRTRPVDSVEPDQVNSNPSLAAE